MSKIIRTPLAIKVSCKCGGVIAGTMLYGGTDIDEDFMNTIAETHNDGGKIELINTNDTPLQLSGCKCSKELEIKSQAKLF